MEDSENKQPRNDSLKWGSIIPLIGGASIGCSISAGCLPQFYLSYKDFKPNEEHLRKYWPSVPRYYLDDNQEPENIQGD